MVVIYRDLSITQWRNLIMTLTYRRIGTQLNFILAKLAPKIL